MLFLLFMFSKINVDGKAKCFYRFYVFKVSLDQTLHPYLQRSRGPSKLVFGNTNSKKSNTFSIKVNLRKHKKQEKHYLPAKLIFGTIKSKKNLIFSLKVDLRNNKKQEMYYRFFQS